MHHKEHLCDAFGLFENRLATGLGTRLGPRGRPRRRAPAEYGPAGRRRVNTSTYITKPYINKTYQANIKIVIITIIFSDYNVYLDSQLFFSIFTTYGHCSRVSALKKLNDIDIVILFFS